MKWPWQHAERDTIVNDDDYWETKGRVLTLAHEMEVLAKDLQLKAKHLKEEVSRGR